jgi:hypothetical protein
MVWHLADSIMHVGKKIWYGTTINKKSGESDIIDVIDTVSYYIKLENLIKNI